MASAIDKIKQGIVEENWTLVDDGYFDLTGQRARVTGQRARVRGKASNTVLVDDVVPKKRGRPKKVEAKAVTPPVVKRQRGKAPTRQEVDASMMVEDRSDQREAQTQRVKTGRKPQFISE